MVSIGRLLGDLLLCSQGVAVEGLAHRMLCEALCMKTFTPSVKSSFHSLIISLIRYL